MRSLQKSVAEIAQHLNRSRSTIYRELRRNCSSHDGNYREMAAGEKYRARLGNSRRNQRYGRWDFEKVEQLIRSEFSPEQIVGRARREKIRIMSHVTIYKHVRADQEAGGNLYRHLRGAQKQRRKRNGSQDNRGRLAGKRMITERPKIVEERKRPGDWEIDTIHGRDKACALTIVDRKTGYTKIAPLSRATAELTTKKTIELLRCQPAFTITSDNGGEFHSYKDIEKELGVKFYFATPHHAWERGTNENTNGLIRQYLKKGTSLKRLTDDKCLEIEVNLNHRPRKRLGYRTPHEAFTGEASIIPWFPSCGKLLLLSSEGNH